MARYEHAGAAAATTLSSAITASSATINITSATGWPTGAVGPFWVTIDAGTASEEKVLITSRTGTALTVSSRGADGTTATPHANGAAIEHTFSATEADAANAHIEASSGVHGRTGALVGTTDTQTLTNKTLTEPTLTTPVVDQFGAASGLGAAWTAYTPTFTGFTATITEARYKQIGKTVHVRCYLTLTSAVTTTVTVSMPVTPRTSSLKLPAGVAHAVDQGTLEHIGIAQADPTNSRFQFMGTDGTVWSNNVPFTWASADVLDFEATYEAA